MFTFLRKIQQRPERERRSIAIWTAFWITAVIFILWTMSFFTRLDRLDPLTDERISDKVSPLNNSKEMFTSFVGSLQASFKGLF